MDCTGVGQPCNVHPNLVVVQKAKGVKAPRASACGAKEIKKKQFQENLVYSVTSLNEKKGETPLLEMFQGECLRILQVPESSLQKLLHTISSSKFQDIRQY